jgi:hypothetical protein
VSAPGAADGRVIKVLALVTTTIQVPRVLEWYRRIDPDVPFFVIGDRQTPHAEIRDFVRRLGNAEYYSDVDQEKLGYASSEALGWCKPGRRCIGMLEAVRSGADIVVTIDDDNIPLGRGYFDEFAQVLSQPFDGLRADHSDGWFDVGQFLLPPVRHRGFPHELWNSPRPPSLSHVIGARVGVAAGLWLGDPDIDATLRLTTAPRCLGVSPVADPGFVVNCSGYAPFNSQNTAFVRELLPVLLMLTPMGRYDDIWASFIAERVMREFDYFVHYGRPFVWQERNPHSPVDDIKNELEGMTSSLAFTRALDEADLKAGDTIQTTAQLYQKLARMAWPRTGLIELGRAWLHDVEKVLT